MEQTSNKRQCTAASRNHSRLKPPSPAKTLENLDVWGEIIKFLPDPETVCRLSASCTQLRALVHATPSIWEAFLEQIPVRARPTEEHNGAYVASRKTPREVVLRFASGRLFAGRMEELARRHRSMLGQGICCFGCDRFPDANGYDRAYAIGAVGRGDAFFVRYSVKGRLVWQGFLQSEMWDDRAIGLGDPREEVDLSEEFDWPELKEYLAYPPPVDSDLYSESWWYEEKAKCYDQLTLTIVVIEDDISDRTLAVSTSGRTKNSRTDPIFNFTEPRMELMPVLSHGVSSIEESLQHARELHEYYGTTNYDVSRLTQSFVSVGHNTVAWNSDDTCFSPTRYIGPVFQSYRDREHHGVH